MMLKSPASSRCHARSKDVVDVFRIKVVRITPEFVELRGRRARRVPQEDPSSATGLRPTLRREVSFRNDLGPARSSGRGVDTANGLFCKHRADT